MEQAGCLPCSPSLALLLRTIRGVGWGEGGMIKLAMGYNSCGVVRLTCRHARPAELTLWPHTAGAWVALETLMIGPFVRLFFLTIQMNWVLKASATMQFA